MKISHANTADVAAVPMASDADKMRRTGTLGKISALALASVLAASPSIGPEPGLDGDCCQNCGGEGFVFDCFDGFCADAEIGCDDCTRPCSECHIRNNPQL